MGKDFCSQNATSLPQYQLPHNDTMLYFLRPGGMLSLCCQTKEKIRIPDTLNPITLTDPKLKK
jgi:hypothetical protein